MRPEREFNSLIPPDIKAVFEPQDIGLIFAYLESFFHISKDYRQMYAYELQQQIKNMNEQEFFYLFVRQNIENHLASLLRQKDCLNRIIRYLLKKKIEEYKINH